MIIHIEVTRSHNGDHEQKGTFKQPWPKVRVKPGTDILWKVQNGRDKDTFVVNFPNGSPFDGVSAINHNTRALPAVKSGQFHYQVFVTDGDDGVVYPIHGCPEMDIP